MSAQATVFVVDDDTAVRSGLALQLEAYGFSVQTFDSCMDFLASFDPQAAGCLILDVRMPDMTGPELQTVLACRNSNLPIIFLSGYEDIPVAVEAIKSGAFDFLTKPVDSQKLLNSVYAALDLNAEQRQRLNR